MGILKLNQVSFSYNSIQYILKDVCLEFDCGMIYGIFGKSGTGKTTLLSLLAGLEFCQEGEVLYNDYDLKAIDVNYYRSHEIGIVFQNYHLLPFLTALENVLLAMDISGFQGNKTKRAYQLLKDVGIDSSLANRPILQLSGGEQQRVSLARALSYDPLILLADEPTGNLDEQTEKDIMALLCRLAHEKNKCVILISHSDVVRECVDVAYFLENTKITKKKG